MKTFDEAVDKILSRRVKNEDNQGEGWAPVDMVEAAEKYGPIHKEVQAHPITTMFLLTLVRSGMGFELALRCAFSHGVIVGMEMNKVDLPEEKSNV